MVGDGTDRPRLERLAHELGVPVTFYGRAPDAELADLYRACDLFVMPSRKEGFGYVFIEAMACGLPWSPVASTARSMRSPAARSGCW